MKRAVVLFLLSACGSSSPSAPATCIEDTECATGQGCLRTASEGYCTPLCTQNAQCTARLACPNLDPVGSKSCVEPGAHKGQGVCEQYVGSLGPIACAAAVVRCQADGVDRCQCPADPGAMADRCRASSFANGGCCSSGDACACVNRVCEEAPALGTCQCGSPNRSIPDAEKNLVETCMPPQGGRCCMFSIGLLGSSCRCSAASCGDQETEVPSCDRAKAAECGALTSVASCN